MKPRYLKHSKICEKCKSELNLNEESILFYSKTSGKWLCYNCYSQVVYDEEIIYFQLTDKEAKMIRTEPLGGGGPHRPSDRPIVDAFDISEISGKCKHAEDYFKKNKLIFRCADCGEWICSSCIKKHKNHSIYGNALINGGEKVLQVCPFLYKSLIDPEKLITKLSIPNKIVLNEKFELFLEIKNLNDDEMYDINIDFQCVSKNNDGTLIESEDINYIDKLITFEFLNPKTSINFETFTEIKNLEYELPKKLTAWIIISYKDFFDSATAKIIEQDFILEKK